MLLVNPDSKIYRQVPNISLAFIATKEGARVVDLNTMPEPKGRFLDHESDLLGVSVRSLTYSDSLRILYKYKARYPQSNGKSVTGIIDVLCCYPFLKLEDNLALDQPFSDSLPLPDYELFDSFQLFKSKWQSNQWHYIVMTSHGCPYQCIYCACRSRPWKARSAEHCHEEILQAKKKWGIVSFDILDDVFNIQKERVLKFCELVQPLKLKWTCANGLRADRFDEELAKALVKAGCYYVSFGVESIIPEILENIKKGETVEQIEKGVNIAKKYFGANVNGFFIIGLPGSSYKMDLETLKWVVKQGISATYSFYIPFDKAVQNDKIFYGGEAVPVSKEYPQVQQKQIYDMVEYMRGAPSMRKIFQAIQLYWQLDREHFLSNSLKGLKKILPGI